MSRRLVQPTSVGRVRSFVGKALLQAALYWVESNEGAVKEWLMFVVDSAVSDMFVTARRSVSECRARQGVQCAR